MSLHSSISIYHYYHYQNYFNTSAWNNPWEYAKEGEFRVGDELHLIGTCLQRKDQQRNNK